MKSNNIILIIIFLVLGLILVNFNKKETKSSYLDNFKGTFSNPDTNNENQYKAKGNAEPIGDKVKEIVVNKTEEISGSFFDDLKEKIVGTTANSTEISNELSEKYYPISKKNNKLEIVKHKAYSLGYSEKHEQAAWTFHLLTKSNTYGDANRSHLDFKPDPGVSTQSALSTDYSRSGYDRGHLVPAGDFKCCQDLLEDTFWVSNLSPQNQDFNRNIWNNLEQATRNWARKNNAVLVYTGPVLADDLPKIGRYNKISVPKYYYKIIVLQNNDLSKTKVKAYLIPNKEGLGYNFNQYAVTVDEIEQKTQLDFLAPLPDKIEDTIESQISTARW